MLALRLVTCSGPDGRVGVAAGLATEVGVGGTGEAVAVGRGDAVGVASLPPQLASEIRRPTSKG